MLKKVIIFSRVVFLENNLRIPILIYDLKIIMRKIISTDSFIYDLYIDVDMATYIEWNTALTEFFFRKEMKLLVHVLQLKLQIKLFPK